MSSSNKEEMKVEKTIKFMVPASNVFDVRKKTEVLQKFARLPMEDQARIEKLIDNSKALTGLKEHWDLLQSMFK